MKTCSSIDKSKFNQNELYQSKKIRRINTFLHMSCENIEINQTFQSKLAFKQFKHRFVGIYFVIKMQNIEKTFF